MDFYLTLFKYLLESRQYLLPKSINFSFWQHFGKIFITPHLQKRVSKHEIANLSKAGLQGWPWPASANLRFQEGWGHSQNSQGCFTMTVFIQHGLCWTCALLSEGLKCWCAWDRRHPYDQSQRKLAHWVSNGLPWHTFQAHIITCFWGISYS